MAITIAGSGITSANIADGTIVNADVADVAASKLTGALPAIDGSSLTGVGKVLQVVQTVKTNGFSFATANAWTDVTGMSVTITPSSTSSKVLIKYNTNISGSTNTAHAYLALTDSANNLVVTPTGSGNINCHSHHNLNDGRDLDNVTFEYLISPSTTSAVTYKLRARTQNSHTAYLNYGSFDSNDGNTISTITAIEVAG